MESPGNDTSVTSATNWTAAGGSFKNSVIFETPLSLIDGKDEDADGDGNDNQGQSSTAADSISKSPLILYPISPDSAPCEITITFAQKHEVQQVYVRSTARVYEIYFASETNSGNEYLCTVRCGIAARDDEVLRVATDSEETVIAHRGSSTKEVVEERFRNGSNLTTSEDDWVEVKLDSPTVINERSSSSSNSGKTQGRRSQLQDLYEATAAINDANPCISITLKLLSLQDKSCLCIDEIYVFADPVSTADLDNEVVPMGNLAGSSLMSMLMPTLMQLSKTRDVGPAQGKLDIDRSSGQNTEETVAKPSDPTDSGNKVQREEKSGLSYRPEVQLQEALTTAAKLVQPEIPPQVSDTESKPDTSHNHIEDALNQLVSRVSRMEDLFFRFEDCMLKPIRSIDERLQRVEQQLEVLTKKAQYTVLPCTRISAPDFSCSESETNSLYNSGCIDLSYAACETNKKDSFPSVSSINSDAIPVSKSMAKSHPSLVVTAPEFSNGDDEEEEEEEAAAAAAETAKEYLPENQKCAMSIDDALASALTGFLSSISAQSPRYSKSLIVKAPDFPNEEENSNDESASPKVPCGRIKEPFTGSNEPEEKEHLRSFFSSLSDISSLESDENMTRLPNNNNCAKTGRDVNEQLLYSKGDEGNFKEIGIDLAASTMHDMKIINSYQITNDTGNGRVGNGTSNTEAIEKQITDDTSNGGVGTATRNIEAVEKSDSLEQFSGYRTDDEDADTTKAGIDMDELNTCTEVGGGTDRYILQNVVELSRAVAQVDFQTPILEVKFTSQENLNAKSPLEALLSGIPGLHVVEEVESVKESHGDDSQIANHSDLIPVEEWDAMSSATDNLVAVDSDYYNLTLLPLIAEDAIHLKNE